MNQQGLHQFRDHCHHQISKQDYIIQHFVDDMTLVSKDKAAITHTIDSLEHYFKLRRLVSIEFLLGVKVERDRPNHT